MFMCGQSRKLHVFIFLHLTVLKETPSSQDLPVLHPNAGVMGICSPSSFLCWCWDLTHVLLHACESSAVTYWGICLRLSVLFLLANFWQGSLGEEVFIWTSDGNCLCLWQCECEAPEYKWMDQEWERAQWMLVLSWLSVFLRVPPTHRFNPLCKYLHRST